MAYIFLGFILLWYILVTLAVKFMTISVLEGVGLGTAGGVFLGAFKDMWQFLWRKASPEEETKAATKPPTA
jgi:hypothetical protein